MKQVWVLVDHLERPLHIFKSKKAAHAYRDSFGGELMQVEKATAVHSVRQRIWKLTNGNCELCHTPITEQTMHMHEQIPRGSGGDISISNSIGICAACHQAAHRKRNPQFTK